MPQKNVLAMVSPVFETMFSSPFEEKDKEEITMPEKRFADFHEFLKCIYPTSPKPVDKDNVFDVLPLADEYQVTSLTTKCRDFLMRYLNENSDKMKSSEILKCYSMCHTYSVEGIGEMCLTEMYRRSKIELDEGDVKHMGKDMLIQYQRQMIVHFAKVNADIETKYVKSLMGRSSNLEEAENVPGFENSLGVTLDHTVSNVFNLKSPKEPECSKQVLVWNTKFNIKAFITNASHNDKYLSVFLNCELPERNKGWSCKVEVIICLKVHVPNTDGEKIVANTRTSHLFTDEEIDWGYNKFRKMSSLIEDLNFNDEAICKSVRIMAYLLVNKPIQE